MSIRIGCSDVINGLNKNHEAELEAESEAVSSTISTDTEEDERSRTLHSVRFSQIFLRFQFLRKNANISKFSFEFGAFFQRVNS